MSISIKGTGYYLPEKVLTNDDLSHMVDTNDEWITRRVGISERRIATFETTEYMAAEAAKKAITSANISPDELDMIIVSTLSGDSISPTTAAAVQAAIGASCPAFDLNSACSGFIFALDTAVSFIMRGGYRNILVIGAERISKMLDWSDRSTCVIFGDGAGAFIVSPGDGYLSSTLYSKGDSSVIDIPAYPGNSPFSTQEKRDFGIIMHGQETFKFAVTRMTGDVLDVLEKAGLTIDDVDYIIPHQANMRILDFASKRLGIGMDKFVVNLNKVGNTSSASVPIAAAQLDEKGGLKPGDIVVLTAFGGGLSSGACVIKW